MPADQRRTPATTSISLDETDRHLLDELQRDARTSIAELGRRVGLSSPAVTDRVRRMTDAGVIRGFHAEVDPRALGLTLGVIVRIRPAPRLLHQVAELAQRTPEVVECHRITGEDCFFLRAHVRDVEHLEELVDRFAPYGQTTTSLLQTSPVPRRGLDLSAEGRRATAP